MRRTCSIIILLFLPVMILGCKGQTSEHRLVGGPCEGCEAIFEYETKLTSVDTLPDFEEEGRRMKLSGTVYQNDGKTPARDVVVYIYHTNQDGIYPTRGDEKGWGRRHGYIRGWARTDRNGRYTFYTLKPAPYPGRSEPAHVHYTILEPDGKYYWLGSVHFKGDSLLTRNETDPESPRGGTSGLLNLEKQGDIWVGERDIILGKNIPGYE
ncbi:intradiol ring-cleavage dioxygenase [Gramella sp. KN1008]|uniref:dioxygenase family protein n=1 Tax=Gramella sp. KN1008 TaxID=2529298 RepID=UPI00103B55C1|nr:intradiol ring-cleavage dioxygenase [Gramella sp. KN1008]TBW30018.1 intradiol ring-cleavage dioxygenase [Gramella sp. KN1008]